MEPRRSILKEPYHSAPIKVAIDNNARMNVVGIHALAARVT